MNFSLLKQTTSIFLFVLFVILSLTNCNNESQSANAIQAPTREIPIAGTAEQQQLFQQTFNELYTRDSVWVAAFENAFSSAFGPDSLKNFLARKTLPHIAVSENREIIGTEKGEFIINSGFTLTVTGVVYGRIAIQHNAKLINNGAIYGNVEQIGGTFEDNGIHQGALIVR